MDAATCTERGILAAPIADMPKYIVLFRRTADDEDYTYVTLEGPAEASADAAPTTVLDVLNTLVQEYINGHVPFTAHIDADGTVRLVLMAETPADVIVYHELDYEIGRMATPGDRVTLTYRPHGRQVRFPENIYVPRDVVVCNAYATLFRKERADGNRTPVELYESVVLPAGIYFDIDALILALNRNIKMRGERNGPVYFFTRGKKRHILRVAAHHRQPHPSQVTFVPTDAGYILGLWEPIDLLLGNKKYRDFAIEPKALVL